MIKQLVLLPYINTLCIRIIRFFVSKAIEGKDLEIMQLTTEGREPSYRKVITIYTNIFFLV
jgi:hypothetical protein